MKDFSLKLVLTAENGQFKAVLVDAKDEVNKFGASAKGAGKDFQDAFGKVGQTVQGINTRFNALRASLIGLAATAASGFIIKTAGEFEKLNAQLVTVEGSAEGAQIAFERIREFAASTPFQVEELTDAFVRLRARGLDPSRDALLAYGNIAAGMSRSLEQAVEAVADAVTGEFERLKEFGIKARNEGDSIRFTFQGVTTSVANNASDIERYLQNLGKVNFAGAMERQAQTLSGVTSNLGDAIAALALKIDSSTGLTGAFKRAAKAATDWLNSLSGVGRPVAVIEGEIEALQKRLDRIPKTGRSSAARFPLAQEISDLQKELGEALAGSSSSSELDRGIALLRQRISDVESLRDQARGETRTVPGSRATVQISGDLAQYRTLVAELGDLNNKLAGAIKKRDAILAGEASGKGNANGSGSGDPTAEQKRKAEAALKAAEQARQKEHEAYLKRLDESADAYERAEELKRAMEADTLELGGKATEAALKRAEAEHAEHLKILESQADDAGIEIAKKLFSAQKVKIVADGIRAEAEKLIADLRDRIGFRDQRSEFVSAAERDRLQGENAADVARTLEQLNSLQGREGAAPLSKFFLDARESLAGFAAEIERAAEGPIARLFRDWAEGTRSMQDAAASWIDSTVNGITELVTGGKANFRDLADSIIKDIIRIQIRAAIAGLIGSIFPAAGHGSGGGGGVPSNFTGGDFGSGAGLGAASRSVASSFTPASLGFTSGVPAAGKFAATQAMPASNAGASDKSGPNIQIINTTGAPAKTQVSRGPDGKDFVRVLIGEVAADIAAGGAVAKTLGTTYGLNRKPGSLRS